jgi:peptide/nickel transport system substrate-binding protein
VVYRQVPEGSNRRALVEAGEVDIAENVPYRELNALEGSESVAIWRTPGNRVFRFELNNEREPFNDVRVRQAMLYATPQQDILDTVFFGFANPLRGPVPSTYPGANTDLWAYDFNQDRARELLRQAGVQEGTQFTITFDSESQLQRDTAAILRSAYEDVGFDVSLEEVSTATYTTNVYQREYQAFFLLEFPIIPDPGYALTLNYPSGSFLNSTGYSNERVDELLAQGFRTTDTVEREGIYDEIQQIMIVEDPPEVWIAEPGWQLVTSPDLKGVNWDTPNIYWINELSR